MSNMGYHAHAHGTADAIVSDHDLYCRLGPNAQARRQEYRGLFRSALAEEFLDAVRAATNGGWGSVTRASPG